MPGHLIPFYKGIFHSALESNLSSKIMFRYHLVPVQDDLVLLLP